MPLNRFDYTQQLVGELKDVPRGHSHRVKYIVNSIRETYGAELLHSLIGRDDESEADEFCRVVSAAFEDEAILSSIRGLWFEVLELEDATSGLRIAGCSWFDPHDQEWACSDVQWWPAGEKTFRTSVLSLLPNWYAEVPECWRNDAKLVLPIALSASLAISAIHQVIPQVAQSASGLGVGVGFADGNVYMLA